MGQFSFGGVHGVSGSFGFGWFGIFLSRLNLPEVEASQPSNFASVKALRALLVTESDQDQRPVLNLVDGDDHFANAILIRRIFDGGVELLWICSDWLCKCRFKPKVRVPMKVERIARDRDDDVGAFLLSQPCSLEPLPFDSDGMICSAVRFGGGLFACVSDKTRDDTNHDD